MKICTNHYYQNFAIGEKKLVYFAGQPGSEQNGDILRAQFEALPGQKLTKDFYEKQYTAVDNYLKTQVERAQADHDGELLTKAQNASDELHAINKDTVESMHETSNNKEVLLKNTLLEIEGVVDRFFSAERPKTDVDLLKENALQRAREKFENAFREADLLLRTQENPYNHNRIAHPETAFDDAYAQFKILTEQVRKAISPVEIEAATRALQQFMKNDLDMIYRKNHVALLLQQSVDAALSEPDPDLKKCSTVLMGVFQKPIFPDGNMPNGPWEILSNGIRFYVERNGKIKVADMSDTAMTNFPSIAQEFGTSSSREIAEIENGGPLKS